MKRKLLIIILSITLLQGNLGVVLAQVASESAVASSSANIISEEAKKPASQSALPMPETISSGVTPTLAPDLANYSASLRLKAHLRSLSKKVFQGTETPKIVVDNARAEDVKLSLFNSDGQKVEAKIVMVSDNDPAVYEIQPEIQSKPGRYVLHITGPDGINATQDFSWGVLAINPNKALYAPNEKADFAIAVLDQTGNMVCDAEVDLQIISPSGEKTVLSVKEQTITRNPECFKKEFTLKPDYEANFQTTTSGVYRLELHAKTQQGDYSITDSFEVREETPFQIERSSATRIFPPALYPMSMKITATQDFTGRVTDTVPASFLVKPLENTQQFKDITLASPSAKQAVLGASVMDLAMPFEGTAEMVEGFGAQVDNSPQGKRYKDFGVIGHDGADFALKDGTPVLAVDSGEIALAEVNGDYGQTVVIQHVWGKSYYGHLSQITGRVGDRIERGHPLGLSGQSGFATGPHLHFALKLNENDPNNGYYGKINPLPFFSKYANQQSGQEVLGVSTNASVGLQQINWDISLKAGESITLGYVYKVPSISPQFYLLGPLEFARASASDEAVTVFQEGRQWQLAVDADGSGSNKVAPPNGMISATGQTYKFTFTASEAMNSGGISLTAPVGWTAPQGTSGTAGYTTVSSEGTIGTVLSNQDSVTGWAAGTACSGVGGLAADTTTKQEGTASLKCVNGNEAVGDVWYKNITSANWSSYTKVGLWVRASAAVTATHLKFSYDDSANLASPLENISLGALVANTWTYVPISFGATTRTAVVSYGFRINNATGLDSKTVWADYILIGPGIPTFAGNTVSVVALELYDGQTISVTYGSGGGTSGVTNPSSTGTYTFTTSSRTSVTGTLTNILTSPTVTLLSGSGTTLNFQISQSSDDAWEHGGGVQSNRTWTGSGTTADTTSVDLYPGRHSAADGDTYSVGARFQNVAVSQGSTIYSAIFSLTPSNTWNANPNIIKYHVSAEASDNAATFTTTVGMLNATSRPRTTVDCGIWNQSSVTSGQAESVDVTSCVQEVINRSGWSSNNSIAIIVDTNAYSYGSQWQTYCSYDRATAPCSGASTGPKLSVTYISTAGGTPTLDQLMRHGKWFNNGVRQPFTF